jgi:hypothetical protein
MDVSREFISRLPEVELWFPVVHPVAQLPLTDPHRLLQTYQWRTQEFCSGGGCFNKFSLGQRERGSADGRPLVRGSGGSSNLVQEISFHIVKFS